jgi:hypothetical protein
MKNGTRMTRIGRMNADNYPEEGRNTYLVFSVL